MEKRRCTQTQCGHYLKGHCRPCDECKAKPFDINTECQRCLACENVPNSLRWGEGDKKFATEEVQQQEGKVYIEVVVVPKPIQQPQMEKIIEREN